MSRSNLWQFTSAFGYLGLLQRVANNTGDVTAWGLAASVRENAPVTPHVEVVPQTTPNVWLMLDVAPRNNLTTPILGNDMTSQSVVELYGTAGPGECQ